MTQATARVLELSDTESRRFGLRIARGVVPAGATAAQVLEDILALRPEVAIFRCNAGSSQQATSLAAAGLVPIHADTLVYYRIALDAPPVPGDDVAAGNDPAFRPATTDDGQALVAIVRRSFAGYRNHYHANPLFTAEAILEGYVEWALGHVIHPGPFQDTWVYRDGDRVLGFACCRRAADGSTVDIVLNAVDPSSVRQGCYGRLLKSMVAHYRRAGIGALEISTQVWNYGVQRIWARTGLVIDRAYDTWHANVPHEFISRGQA